jgi:hypothetical protein
MRKLALLHGLIGVLLTLGCAGLLPKLSWQSFTAPDGSFTVQMPGTPQSSNQTVAVNRADGGGVLNLQVTGYMVDVKNSAFMVLYFDIPANTPYDVGAGIQGMADAWGGKVLSKSDATLGGHRATAFSTTMTKPTSGQCHGRLAVVGTRVYVVVVGSTYRQASDPDVVKFLDSFALAGAKPAPKPAPPVDPTPPEPKPIRDPVPGQPLPPDPPPPREWAKERPPDRTVALPVQSVTEAAEATGPLPFEVDPKLKGASAKVYLSDMQEFAYRAGPANWSLGKNGLKGSGYAPTEAIKVNGEAAAKGLGMHPPDRGYSRVCYVLGKQAKAFYGAVALADVEGQNPNATRFVILGDGKVLWRCDVREKGKATDFALDVNEVNVLELRTIISTPPCTGAHAAWLDPFVRTK